MNSILFGIVVADAIAIMLLGIVSAILILFGIKAERFFERVPPATIIVVLTSFGAGALLWGAGYLFGGLS